MHTTRFTPNSPTPPITVPSAALAVAVNVCTTTGIRFLPATHDLRTDGPITLRHRHTKRAGQRLLHTARSLELQHHDLATQVLYFAVALLHSKGGTLTAV